MDVRVQAGAGVCVWCVGQCGRVHRRVRAGPCGTAESMEHPTNHSGALAGSGCALGGRRGAAHSAGTLPGCKPRCRFMHACCSLGAARPHEMRTRPLPGTPIGGARTRTVDLSAAEALATLLATSRTHWSAKMCVVQQQQHSSDRSSRCAGGGRSAGRAMGCGVGGARACGWDMLEAARQRGERLRAATAATAGRGGCYCGGGCWGRRQGSDTGSRFRREGGPGQEARQQQGIGERGVGRARGGLQLATVAGMLVLLLRL
jgi:hypothetical protein